MNVDVVILGDGNSAKIAATFCKINKLQYVVLSENINTNSDKGLFYCHKQMDGFSMSPVIVNTDIFLGGLERVGLSYIEYSKKVSAGLVDIEKFEPSITTSNDVRWAIRLELIDPEKIIKCKLKTLKFGNKEIGWDGGLNTINYGICINTLPLNVFTSIIDYPDIDAFKYNKIGIKIELPTKYVAKNCLNVVYIPSLQLDAYRVSTSSKTEIIEEIYQNNKNYDHVIEFGKIFRRANSYGYFCTLFDYLRDKSILCLGRYARWDRKYLLHQVWDDLKFELGV